MRVAIVTPTLLLGGLERIVHDLALGLARRGIPTGVFSTGRTGVYAEGLEQAGIDVHRSDRTGRRLLRVSSTLARDLAAFAPSIIHGHSGTWLPCALARFQLRDPLLVYTDHGRYPPERTLHLLIEKHVCQRQTDQLVAVSSDLAAYLREVAGLPGAAEVIPNGIDLGHYGEADPGRRARLRAEWGVNEGEILIIAVGRLEPVKNHPSLLAALSEIRAAGHPARVALVGTGREDERLRQLVERLGISDATLFLGHRRDVPDCLRAADIFASSSTTEGLPVSLLEAMAAGLPIVATAVGGIPETLGDPAAGVLVPAGDDRALAAATARLVEDPQARARLGAAARERARSYSLEACVERYCDLYERLLTRAEGGARGAR